MHCILKGLGGAEKPCAASSEFNWEFSSLEERRREYGS